MMSLFVTAIVIALCVCVWLWCYMRQGGWWIVPVLMCTLLFVPPLGKAYAVDFRIAPPYWYEAYGIVLATTIVMYRWGCDGIGDVLRRSGKRRAARSVWQAQSIRWRVETE